MDLSVIICTHNPRADFLSKTLSGLSRQSLPTLNWELLLIDNASPTRLANDWDLTWHPNARHLEEHNLGLTHARLRGIEEARGEIVMFVDDDLIIADNTCENVLAIAKQDPAAGGGGGKISGELVDMGSWPEWMDADLRLFLAIRDRGDEPFRAPPAHGPGVLPPGACVWYRRSCLDLWVSRVKSQKLSPLDRRGTSLWSDGDMDMNHCIIEQGCHLRYDPTLSGSHLIPSRRLELSYFTRLLYWIGRSSKRRENRAQGIARTASPAKLTILAVQDPVSTARQLLRLLGLRPLPRHPDPSLPPKEIRESLYKAISTGRSDESILQSICPWTL